jgi:hypothetical protein
MAKRWGQILQEYLRRMFSIDLRTLAIFRITLALLIIADLFNAAISLRSHYTDFGVLPRGALIDNFNNVNFFSLYFMSGEAWFQFLLFFIAGVFALGMLVGYHTRMMTIISWFFLVSLHNRNPLVLQGGDTLFRMILFWAMFLPLGARYSLDWVRAKLKPQVNSVFSVASAGLLLQVAILYLATASQKTGTEWWPQGSATYYALMLEHFSTYFGKWLLQQSNLLTPITYGVYALEWGAAFLLLFPTRHWQLRFGTATALIVMHQFFGFCLRLGLFPFADLVALIPFIPGPFLDWCTPKLATYSWWRALQTRFYAFTCWLSSKVQVASTEGWNGNPQHPFFAVFSFACLASIINWNLANDARTKVSFPEVLKPFMWTLRLDQDWGMFSPYPMKDGGWYVIEGQTIDGRTVDVWNNKFQNPSYEKPEHVSSTYDSARWRKYMLNIWLKQYADHRLHYGRHLCRKWNEKTDGNNRLYTFQVHYMKQDTLPNYKLAPVENVTIWSHRCFDEDRTAMLQ